MVMPSSPEDRASEATIVLSYAPRDARTGLAALFALDDTLGSILRTTREPMVGQMRLTWWHGALSALDEGPAPAEPVLQSLATHVVARATGETLARQVEGWEELLDPDPLDHDRLRRYADGRGGAMFAAAATVCGAAADGFVAEAGAGWALADLADHVGDAATARSARLMADDLLHPALSKRWPRPLRALGAMAHLAAMPGRSPPARAGRILWHRLTGR